MNSAFLLAAPSSGAGKTTVTLAILAALQARGVSVQAFKVGPDYIDPAHHTRITGLPSHNLDTWMIPAGANRRIFGSAVARADVAVVEGVMGLYDGVDGKTRLGSSAGLAQLLDLPVILVVDARAMAQSAAALVLGMVHFDPGVRIVGVIWNRVGSGTHRRLLDEALEAAALPASVGAIPRSEAVAIPERHLGLVTPEDAVLAASTVTDLAQLAETHLDLESLLERTRYLPVGETPAPSARLPAHRRRIGVPRDAAYCFYYEENLRLLESAGAEIVVFQPSAGDAVPANLDGLYLGGGYPEVHAARITANHAYLDGIRRLHQEGKPIYAECGGFMTLCESVDDLGGRRHRMAGIYPTRARMEAKRFSLGYREVRTTASGRLHDACLRGHEFHYSHVDPMPDPVARAFRVWNARGEELPPEGYRIGQTLGGYIHLHFASDPGFPVRFFGLDE